MVFQQKIEQIFQKLFESQIILDNLSRIIIIIIS
jgi:hypothetical protein